MRAGFYLFDHYPNSELPQDQVKALRNSARPKSKEVIVIIFEF